MDAPVEVENFLNVLPEHKNITFPSSDCESQRRNFSWYAPTATHLTRRVMKRRKDASFILPAVKGGR
jgi:hypothetical protein|tara:strand:- start:157 stop:357 length:201 start_codon:yes stop_codon:yes gene_type:complete